MTNKKTLTASCVAHITKIDKKCEELAAILGEIVHLNVETPKGKNIKIGLPPYHQFIAPLVTLLLNYIDSNIMQTIQYTVIAKGKKELKFWRNEFTRWAIHPKFTKTIDETVPFSQEEIWASLRFKTITPGHDEESQQQTEQSP